MSTSGSGFYVTIATPKGSTIRRVEGDLLSVGRAEDCNLRIVHAELGRRHLSLMLQGGRCCVEDHGSTNGTYVNGKRIPPHVPTPVSPKDQVQLGQSGIRLMVSTDIDHPRSVTNKNEKVAKTDNDPFENSIVTSTQNQRIKALHDAPTPPERISSNAVHEQSERVLFEAQKKAALLLQQAEIDSERKVQDIYRRAEETLEKAEKAYQRKLNEVFLESEQVYQKSQAEAAQIIDSARQNAADIRAQAEAFVVERRKRTDEDCELALDEAQRTARELKENRLLEADDMIRAKEEELLKETREAMSQRLALFENDLQRDAERQRDQLDEELSKRRAEADLAVQDQQNHIDKLKLEVRQLIEVSQRERKVLEDLETSIEKESEKTNQLKTDAEKASVAYETHRSKLTEMRNEIGKLETTQFNLQKQVSETQTKLAGLSQEERGVQTRVESARESIKTDLIKIKDHHESARVKLVKIEEAHLEQLKLETARKGQRLEQEMFEELQVKKARISREIGLTVETFLKENPSPNNRMIKKLQEDLDRQLDIQVVSLSKDPSSKNKRLSLIALKRAERWRVRVMGAVVGAALLWLGQMAEFYVRNDLSPIERRVAAVAEERKLELERRKFNPAQTLELKDNYVDAVIYTENFRTTYLKDEFQKKFLQALAPYMLKTWRIEEEKSIELLAASASLVKELSDKRENIHPDFVQKDIAKMHELENESIGHITQILGSQVRYESFKKFEKQFYQNYR